MDALAAKDVGSGLKVVQDLVVEGSSLTEFTAQVIDYLRGVMLLQMTSDATLLSEWPQDAVETMTAQAQTLSQAATLFAIKRFSEAASELRGGYNRNCRWSWR